MSNKREQQAREREAQFALFLGQELAAVAELSLGDLYVVVTGKLSKLSVD